MVAGRRCQIHVDRVEDDEMSVSVEEFLLRRNAQQRNQQMHGKKCAQWEH